MCMELVGKACAIALSVVAVMLLSVELEHLNRIQSVTKEASHQKALSSLALRGIRWQITLAISAIYLTVYFHAEWMTAVAVAFSCGICWLTFGYTEHSKTADQARLHRALEIAGLPIPDAPPGNDQDSPAEQTTPEDSQEPNPGIDTQDSGSKSTQAVDTSGIDSEEHGTEKHDSQVDMSNGDVRAQRPHQEDS
jgi:hypothetical protein